MREMNTDLLHEALMKRKPLLAFDENADYDEWKAKVKEKYLEILAIEEIAKNTCELKIEIEETVKKDGYTRYRYVFESEKGCYVPCYLLVPDTGKEKYPVIALCRFKKSDSMSKTDYRTISSDTRIWLSRSNSAVP